MVVESTKLINAAEPVQQVAAASLQPKISSTGARQRASAAFLQVQRSAPLASQLRADSLAASNRDGDVYEPSMMAGQEASAHDVLRARKGLRWLIEYVEGRVEETIEQAEQQSRERAAQIREQIASVTTADDQAVAQQAAQQPEQAAVQQMAAQQGQPAGVAAQARQEVLEQAQPDDDAAQQEQAGEAAQDSRPAAVKARLQQAKSAYESFTKTAERPYKPATKVQQLASHMVRGAEDAA